MAVYRLNNKAPALVSQFCDDLLIFNGSKQLEVLYNTTIP